MGLSTNLCTKCVTWLLKNKSQEINWFLAFYERFRCVWHDNVDKKISFDVGCLWWEAEFDGRVKCPM